MASDDSDRRQLHALLSVPALEGWSAFARAHHTNVAALLEALGLTVGRYVETQRGQLPPVLREAVMASHEIASRRTVRKARGSS